MKRLIQALTFLLIALAIAGHSDYEEAVHASALKKAWSVDSHKPDHPVDSR